MTLDQVIELLHDALVRAGKTGPNALPAEELYRMAREIWIEHLALPILPVTSIADRLVSGKVAQEERVFWERHGLLAEKYQ